MLGTWGWRCELLHPGQQDGAQHAATEQALGGRWLVGMIPWNWQWIGCFFFPPWKTWNPAAESESPASFQKPPSGPTPNQWLLWSHQCFSMLNIQLSALLGSLVGRRGQSGRATGTTGLSGFVKGPSRLEEKLLLKEYGISRSLERFMCSEALVEVKEQRF